MSGTTGPAGVILMAYGAPASLEDVAAFFTHIRHGRRPPEDRIEELRSRYRSIGGVESLLRVTESQAAALRKALAEEGGERVEVFFGMRHASPFIAERAAEIAAFGIGRLVGLPLAPHFSTMSVGAYHAALREAVATLKPSPELLLIDSWHDHPRFIAALAGALRECLEGIPSPPRVIFTAHSLPERIVAAGEPYRDQLLETARLTALAAGVAEWEFAFQSASPTGEPWLGPDLFDVVRRLAAEGHRRLVVQPVGFVADHLEILYDIDILAKRIAAESDVDLRRPASMNTRPAFIAALAALTRERLEKGRGAPAP